MAIALVQHVQNHNSGSGTLSTAITSTGAGNAIVVIVGAYASTGQTISSVTLSGTGLTSVASSAADANSVCSAWVLLNTAGSQTSVAVTAGTGGANAQINVNVYEFSGVLTASALDQTSTGTASALPSWSTGTTGTTTDPNEVAVGGMNGYATTAFTVTGPGGSWINGTTITNSVGGTLFTRQLAGYQILSATGTVVYSGSTSINTTTSAPVITLKGPSAASVALPVTTVAIATPAPGITAGDTVPLPVTTVAIATPAPSVSVAKLVPLPVTTVAIATPAPGVTHGNAVPLPVTTIGVATPAPGVTHGNAVPLPVTTIGVATPAPGIDTARTLLVAIASQAGTDDYGTAFPAGLFSASGVILLYNGTPALGTLFYSNSPAGGTDAYGNVYPQGEAYYGIANLTSLFTIEDGSGNTLASIDSEGNITGQVISGSDVIINGASFNTNIYPSLPEGSAARTFIPSGDLPTGALSGEVSLYELDVALSGGRSYMVLVENQQWQLGATGQRLRINVRATTDGTTPSTSTDLFMQGYADGAFNAFVTIPCMSRLIQPSGATLFRALMTVQPSGTATALSWSGSNFLGGQDALSVIDLGDAVPNTGVWIGTGSGGGTPPQNYVTTWSATDTYAYEGTNADSSPNPGFTPGALINHNGKALTGDDQLGDNGNCSTFIVWPAAVATTLSGATITDIKLILTNNHSWYSTGLTVSVGKTTATPGGGSRPSITSAGLVTANMAEGATRSIDLSGALSTFAFALNNGNAFVLYHSTSSRQFYGYFAGGSGGGNTPQITVSYTK